MNDSNGRRWPRLDGTVNLGHIIQLVGFTVAATAAYITLAFEIDALNAKMDAEIRQ